MALMKMPCAVSGGASYTERLYITSNYQSGIYTLNYVDKDGVRDSTTLSNGGATTTWHGYTFSNIVITGVNANCTITIERSTPYLCVDFNSDRTAGGSDIVFKETSSETYRSWSTSSYIDILG